MYKQIYFIIKDGLNSLMKDVDGVKCKKVDILIYFCLSPIIVSIIIGILKINISCAIDTLLTCLSIFTTLIFALLFTVPERLSSRIDSLRKNKDDATKNYLKRFINFSKMFIQQISIVIIISLSLIILLIIQKIYYCQFLTLICIYLFIIMFAFIMQILANTYILLKDEIEVNKGKMKK